MGLIRTENDEGSRLGKYECWVNCELFISQMELQLEDEGHHDKVLAVVHTVSPEMNIDSKTLGSFLQANSKDFSAKFHEKLTYQDLLRFSSRVLSEDNSNRAKKFVRNTLRGFPKGNKNSTTFIQWAGLPSPYLLEFDKYCSLYESGSCEQRIIFGP